MTANEWVQFVIEQLVELLTSPAPILLIAALIFRNELRRAAGWGGDELARRGGWTLEAWGARAEVGPIAERQRSEGDDAALNRILEDVPAERRQEISQLLAEDTTQAWAVDELATPEARARRIAEFARSPTEEHQLSSWATGDLRFKGEGGIELTSIGPRPVADGLLILAAFGLPELSNEYSDWVAAAELLEAEDVRVTVPPLPKLEFEIVRAPEHVTVAEDDESEES